MPLLNPHKLQSPGPSVEGASSQLHSPGPSVEGASSQLQSPGPSVEGVSSQLQSSGPTLEGASSQLLSPEQSSEPASSQLQSPDLSSESAASSQLQRPGPSEGTASRSQLQILSEYSEEWLDVLDGDNKKSLSLFLCYNLVHHFQLNITQAAEIAAKMINKSDRTVRQWRTDLVLNDGVLPETKQGKYQRSGVLWYNEDLNKTATEYIRANATVKGTPNMTTIDFCKWVNSKLLPNCTLEPGYPRKTSVETARKWLHELGFEVITPRKGIYIDGHEREDRKTFLRRMVKIGFLHFTNAPTESSQQAIPKDIDPPTIERRSKTVMFFHDESTFNANEDQNIMWGTKGQKMIKPKSRGAGIMVSDFIDVVFLHSVMKNMKKQRKQFLASGNMLVNSLNMERARRATGPGTGLSHKWREQL